MTERLQHGIDPNMRMFRLATALLVLILALPVSAASQDASEPRTLILGMPVSGTDIRVVTGVLQAVFDPAGYRLVHEELPYKRALDEMAAGRIQCTLTVKGVLKEGHAAHTPLAIFHPSIAYIEASGFPGVEEMAGQKVAHLYGYDVQRFLPVEILSQPAYELTSAMQMLDRGHVRYVLDDEYLIEKAIRDSGLPRDDFGIFRLTSQEVVPIFAPTEEGRRLQQFYDQRMQTLIYSGQLLALLKQYGMEEERIRELLASRP